MIEKEAKWEQPIFWLTSIIAPPLLIRNFLRLSRYAKPYEQLKGFILAGSRMMPDPIHFRTGKRQLLLLEPVFPVFPTGLFNHSGNPQKYSSALARFYEDLQCDSEFDGRVRLGGRQVTVHFTMNRPCVGFQLANGILQLQKRKTKIHKSQIIAVLGEMSYSRDRQRLEMETKMIGIDNRELRKYWELKMLATIFSSFYCSILLGIAISIYGQSPHYLQNFIKKIKEQTDKIMAT